MLCEESPKMEAAVGSSHAHWSATKNLQETLAQAEKMAKEGKPPSIPPKQILQYLVRMGSFTSVPLTRDDIQDLDIQVPAITTRETLLNRCTAELPKDVPLITRNFVRLADNAVLPHPQSRIKYANSSANGVSQDEDSFRILTWNVLAQALAVGHDNFVGLPEGTLNWSDRRFRILHEILLYDPDVVCLQEVDHFNFLNTCLTAVGYRGVFCSKPDSPCIYVTNNNGPDGCALFYRKNRFDLISASSRILEIWRVQSNQVCIFATLRLKETGKQVCVATTHLKARQGALLSTMRNEQGKDMANYVTNCGGSSKPLIMCGDFNAVPTEPVIDSVKSRLGVESAYSKLYNGEEPPYTTWKIRGDAEYCHTIDYIFHNSHCDIESLLLLPTEEQVGPTRLPNLSYASDHIAIACDVKIH